MLDRTVAPSFTLPDSVPLVEAESFLLNNGCSFHVVSAGKQDVIRLELIYKAGSKEDTFKGVSYFTSKMLTEGTSSLNAKQIIEYLDLYGAFYELHHGPDNINLTFYFLKKYSEKISAFIVNVLSDVTFPIDELENNKNITLQNLKVNQKKNSYLASVGFKEHLFGVNHPYGRILKEDDITKIERTGLISFYDTFIKEATLEVVVSGNVDENTANELKAIFGSLKVNNNSSNQDSHVVAENQIGLFIEEKDDTVQSSIRVGTTSIKKNHPDYFYWVILNEILGGYFGSRLMKNIREEKGFTYGISSSIAHMEKESYFVIGTDVKKDNTQQTLDEIQKEIDILKTTLIPIDELQTVKNYMLGTFLSSINTPFSLADKFKSIHFHNLGYSFYSNYLKNVKMADPAILKEIANKYLDYEKMVKVVVGGI